MQKIILGSLTQPPTCCPLYQEYSRNSNFDLTVGLFSVWAVECQCPLISKARRNASTKQWSFISQTLGKCTSILYIEHHLNQMTVEIASKLNLITPTYLLKNHSVNRTWNYGYIYSVVLFPRIGVLIIIFKLSLKRYCIPLLSQLVIHFLRCRNSSCSLRNSFSYIALDSYKGINFSHWRRKSVMNFK